MEWLEGEDLARALLRGCFTIEKTVSLLRNLSGALSVAHAMGIVHRDIKPSNIFLPDGLVDAAKLIDFGVARIKDLTGTWTRDGWMLGTPAYMAPEQIRGGRQIDGRSDLFSLGCVAFECLTGRAPFGDTPVLEVLKRIQLGQADSIRESRPDLAPDLERLLTSMIATDPDARPKSANAVLNALPTGEGATKASSSYRPIHRDNATRTSGSMRPGDVIADRFELLSQAASGGMGTVWKARDRLTGYPVAVKVLTGTSENDRTRFLREAAVLADLEHPGIVRYLSHGTTPSYELYLVMEWLEGEDLSNRLQSGPLPVETTLTLAMGIAGALAAAHGRGVVHRDVKPSNVFLPFGEIEKVKVLDFGVARVASVSGTRTGVMVGTPGYMAPEQARGERELDARADVFALGCVMFECLTGRRAFEAGHVMAVLAKILLDDPPRVSELLPNVSADLDDLVGRMLAKDPSARPRDGAELGTLLSVIAERPSMARPNARRPALTRSEQRVLCAVLVPPEQPLREAANLELLQEVRNVVEQHAGRLETLADGSLLAILAGKGAANDLAAQTARCAIAMRRMLPHMSMSLTVGRGEIGAQLAGVTIDRASKLLHDDTEVTSDETSANIVLDDVTASLLTPRFAVRPKNGGFELLGELELDEKPRILLGRATACVGREPELSALEASFTACRDEPVARAVLVTAPAGGGKSRLRKEFITRLRERRISNQEAPPIQIWLGSGDPMNTGSAFGLAAQMVRYACAIEEGETLDARRRKVEARVGDFVKESSRARVTEFLGEMIDTPFPDDDSVQLRAARRDAMLMADQIRDAWEHFTASVCETGPVLLVLEDLHWGDVATVKLLDATLRNLRDQPLFVLALARPEVHEVFPKLWAERDLQQLRLAGLTRKASERLAKQVLGDDISAETVRTIIDRADGNPFYLEELIRAIAERRDEYLPETVVAMVEVRLEKLHPEARRILRAASVFGQTFWKGGIVKLLGGGGSSIAEWLKSLVDQEFLSKHSASKFEGEDEFSPAARPRRRPA